MCVDGVPGLNLLLYCRTFLPNHICFVYGVLASPKDFCFIIDISLPFLYAFWISSCLKRPLFGLKCHAHSFWFVCLLLIRTEKIKKKWREWLEGSIHVGSGEDESICFREKRRARMWGIDHRVRLRAQERRHLCEVKRDCEGPCRRVVGHWYIQFLGEHFNSGLQTFLTLT